MSENKTNQAFISAFHSCSDRSVTDCGITQTWMWGTLNISVATGVLILNPPPPPQGIVPWSAPSRRRHGHPGTCSCRTWRGRRFWSQFHSWRRGAKTHRAVGQATSLQTVFKHMTFVFLFAFIWDSLPLLEGSPAKQESILPLKDQQPGFRGQRTCNHSRLHSQQIYRPLYLFTVRLERLSENYTMISSSVNRENIFPFLSDSDKSPCFSTISRRD